MSEQFDKYRRTQVAEMRPYREGEALSERVSVSASDREAGSPKAGDMIARNPANYADQWLVAADYFAANFEPMAAKERGTPACVEVTVTAPAGKRAHVTMARVAARDVSWTVTEGQKQSWTVEDKDTITVVPDATSTVAHKRPAG